MSGVTSVENSTTAFTTQHTSLYFVDVLDQNHVSYTSHTDEANPSWYLRGCLGFEDNFPKKATPINVFTHITPVSLIKGIIHEAYHSLVVHVENVHAIIAHTLAQDARPLPHDTRPLHMAKLV